MTFDHSIILEDRPCRGCCGNACQRLQQREREMRDDEWDASHLPTSPLFISPVFTNLRPKRCFYLAGNRLLTNKVASPPLGCSSHRLLAEAHQPIRRARLGPSLKETLKNTGLWDQYVLLKLRRETKSRVPRVHQVLTARCLCPCCSTGPGFERAAFLSAAFCPSHLKFNS